MRRNLLAWSGGSCQSISDAAKSRVSAPLRFTDLFALSVPAMKATGVGAALTAIGTASSLREAVPTTVRSVTFQGRQRTFEKTEYK
ncbi:MAG: hypothetical protein V7L29_06700 [Nostoc sp.]|uniref:hypothetical protein n=1 Tax=Nostoc sp. TaxID=1180 RepID=UPI002FF65FDE